MSGCGGVVSAGRNGKCYAKGECSKVGMMLSKYAYEVALFVYADRFASEQEL